MGTPAYADVPTDYSDEDLINSDDLIADLQALIHAFDISPVQSTLSHVQHRISSITDNILCHRCSRCVLRTGLRNNRTDIVRCTLGQHRMAVIVSTVLKWLCVFCITHVLSGLV
jgi:hypothetical protein